MMHPFYSEDEINLLMKTRSWDELVRIGEPAVDPLIAGLRRNKISSARFVLATLGNIGDRRATATLIEYLKLGDYSLRCAAAKGLGKIGDPDAVKPLVFQLTCQNKSLRREAAQALGLIGDSAAVDPLIRLLSLPDKYLQRDAAVALTLINDPRSAHPLIGYILKRQPFFWEELRKSLATFLGLNALRSQFITVRDNYNWRQ